MANIAAIKHRNDASGFGLNIKYEMTPIIGQSNKVTTVSRSGPIPIVWPQCGHMKPSCSWVQ
jgi:hypothetical protein